MMLDTFYSKTLGLVAYNLARLKSLSSNSLCCISASAKTLPKVSLCLSMRWGGGMYCFLDWKCNEDLTTGKTKHLHMLEQALKVLVKNLNCYAAVSGFFFFVPSQTLTLGGMIDFWKYGLYQFNDLPKSISSVQIRWGRYIPNPFSHNETELLSVF